MGYLYHYLTDRQWRRQNFAPGGRARTRGARVPKFVVTKSSRSESHLASGLQKRIWLKFFLQQPATVTAISALICVIGYITANKKRLQNFACIKLEEGRHVPQCPMPGDSTGHKQTRTRRHVSPPPSWEFLSPRSLSTNFSAALVS